MLDKTINLFGDPRVNEVISANIINEYCKREFLKEALDVDGLWAGDSV